jgi:hypothetical protein
MRLLRWKPVVRGSLRGFLDLALTVENDRPLEVYEWAMHVGPNGPWASPPGKAQIDRGGNLIRKPNGRPEYTAVMKWTGHQTGNRFGRAVMRMLLDKHPNALDAEQTP